MNHVLAQLSPQAFERLRPHLEPVALPLGTQIYEAGALEDGLYFVSSGVVSLLKVTATGAAVEIAVVGREGVVGVEMFTGGRTAGWRAVVQSAARAFRLGADDLQRELAADRELEEHLLRFTEALMQQISQTALCNRHHSIEQQFCRWLLASMDRLGTHELGMTQALIARLLGVRREGISFAAGKLQAEGLIRYTHGRIAVLQRELLESRACECYAAVNAAYRELLYQAVR
jgi:CRP-like cAMP-binding protein